MLQTIQSLLKRLRDYWQRLLRLQARPKQLARGLAVGVFAGFFPLLGFQTIIAVSLAIVCSGNKFAAAAGAWVSNPLTFAPIFLFNFQVGNWLLGGDKIVFEQDNWMEVVWEASYTLFLGCFVVGSLAAIATYFIALYLIGRRKTD